MAEVASCIDSAICKKALVKEYFAAHKPRFPATFTKESYLLAIRHVRDRHSCARLRTDWDKLFVCTATSLPANNSLQRHQQTCRLCNGATEVKDVLHILTKCLALDHVRTGHAKPTPQHQSQLRSYFCIM